ncbi:MAG: PAS domain S-box protein [Balneolaceae bacterium]|nr:PAS domain S-box protein [Balneolaceae bacterium]
MNTPSSSKNRDIEALVHSLNGILWEADGRTFQFTYLSPQVEQILGYTPEVWYNDPDFWANHIHPEDRDEAIRFCHDKTKRGEHHEFEYRMIDAEGQVVWIRDSVTVLMKEGEVDKLSGFMTDITETKKIQQRYRQARIRAYQLAGIGHWEIDLANDHIYWSDEVRLIHEVDRDFNPTMENGIAFYLEGEDRIRVRQLVQDTIDSGKNFEEEFRIKTAKGNERWIRLVGECETTNGQTKRIIGTMQNITEQKRAEQHHREVEQKLQQIVEHSTNLFFQHDLDHNITYCSPQSKDFVGYEPEEAKIRWTEFLTDHPINKKGIEYTCKALETGMPQPSYELQFERKDGQLMWVLVNEKPVLENGKVIGMSGSLTDITPQKEYEQQLQRQKDRLQQSQRIGQLGDFRYEVTTDTIFWSENMYEIFERDQRLGPPPLEELQDHYDDKFRDIFAKALREGIGYDEVLAFETWKGNQIYVRTRAIPKKDSSGDVVSVEGAVVDVSDLVQVQEELKKKKKQLDHFINNINGMLHRYRRNPDGSEKMLFVSQGVMDLFELSPDQVMNSTNDMWSQVVDEDLPGVVDSINQSAEDLSFWDHKWRIVTPSGLRKWVHGRGTPFRQEDGSIIWDSLLFDVTEHENAKRQLEEHHRIIENNQAETYIICKEELVVIYANPVACENIGYNLDQITGKAANELIRDGSAEDLRSLLKPLDEGNGDSNLTFEAQHRRADGTFYDTKIVFRKDTFSGEEVYIASALDITEQKALRNDLQKQISLTNEVLNSLPGLFYMMDLDMKMVRVNDNVINFFGIDRSVLSKISPLRLIAPRERNNIRHKIKEVLTKGYAEVETRMTDGEQEYHFYINGTLFEQGGQRYIIGNGINIDDRVRAHRNNEILLQEVHHRVKNNLAIISGLLQLELQRSEDQGIQIPLQRSINRIQSMAKVHELLYQNNNFSSLNIRRYIEDMMDTISSTFVMNAEVSITYNIDEVEMNLNEAIPLGMLMNELVTNSFKYAFTDRTGEIHIEIEKPNNHYEVRYRDNGPGLDQHIRLEKADSLGLTIVYTLLQQLEADYTLRNDNGFVLEFSFQPQLRGSHSNL